MIKYVNIIPAAQMFFIREKFWRLRAAMRDLRESSKSIEVTRSQTPVEVRFPSHSLEQVQSNNNYILQLSDELLLRIFTFLDVKDLIR